MSALRLFSSLPRRLLHTAARVPSPYLLHSPNKFTTSIRNYASHSPRISKDPITETAEEWFEDGVVKWNENDLIGAIESYEKSIYTKPTGEAYYNIGFCYYQLGKHEKAADSWTHSLTLSPERADAHVNLANIYALSPSIRNPEKALSHYEAAIRIEPEDGEIRYNYAVVLESVEKLEEAVAEYKKAFELGVRKAEVNIRNAGARLMSKQLKKMEELEKNKDKK
ncbi:hypothetical protein HK098_001338 [Nowakowskiella sp. JEL0407]|nr:hypothetical protein HK098_001338 [Nowakowskiella sp. JEL0407]